MATEELDVPLCIRRGDRFVLALRFDEDVSANTYAAQLRESKNPDADLIVDLTADMTQAGTPDSDGKYIVYLKLTGAETRAIERDLVKIDVEETVDGETDPDTLFEADVEVEDDVTR